VRWGSLISLAKVSLLQNLDVYRLRPTCDCFRNACAGLDLARAELIRDGDWVSSNDKTSIDTTETEPVTPAHPSRPCAMIVQTLLTKYDEGMKEKTKAKHRELSDTLQAHCYSVPFTASFPS